MSILEAKFVKELRITKPPSTYKQVAEEFINLFGGSEELNTEEYGKELVKEASNMLNEKGWR